MAVSLMLTLYFLVAFFEILGWTFYHMSPHDKFWGRGTRPPQTPLWISLYMCRSVPIILYFHSLLSPIMQLSTGATILIFIYNLP